MLDPVTTRLTFKGHACVELERGGRRLVIDPGAYSDLTVLSTADAVLVTHEHGDHLAVDDLVAALDSHPDLLVWAPAAVVARLADAGADGARLHAVVAGDTVVAAGMPIAVMGEEHALIHPDVPRLPNVGYLVDGLVLHPGDAFTVPPTGQPIAVLLVPVSGPWLSVAPAIDYVRAVNPVTAVPIHDALLSSAGIATMDRLVSSLGGAGSYRRLALGEGIDVG